MTAKGIELFGNAAQRTLLRRGAAMFDLLGNDPRYTYYGRTVGLATPGDGPISALGALATLQGSSHYGSVPDAAFDEHRAAAEARGLTVTRYTMWRGGRDALGTADAVIAAHALPGDVTVQSIGADTPVSVLESLADVALACGVLPPAGAVLRGQTRAALGLVALDGAGRAVACAGAAAFRHSARTDGLPQCWWGMLATRPDRRGERLALVLGALALRQASERFEFSEFFTGVEPGNAASETVCTRMGLAPSAFSTLSVADAAQLPGGRMTK